jgi:hypothetical protein
MGHGMMLELSRTRRQVWNRGTCGNTRALPHREEGPVSYDTWRHRSPPVPGGGSGTVGHVVTPEPSRAGR